MKDLSKTHKKHIKFFTLEEKSYIEHTIKKIYSWSTRPHAINKLKERGGSLQDVYDALKQFNIIEFHALSGEPRVLIRGIAACHTENICVVLAPKTEEIVTAYYNDVNDNHFTIDMKKYTKSINILEKM